MNTIVILCGANSCGKSITLKGFFGIAKETKSPDFYIERKLDSKTICAVGFGSAQEKVKDFCNVDEVQKNINLRIIESKRKNLTTPYFLIIPFTMSSSHKKKKKVNEDCILKPIEELKNSDRVFVIYLRKINTHYSKEKDALMENIALRPFILTTKVDYDKSKDLERLLRGKILKSS